MSGLAEKHFSPLRPCLLCADTVVTPTSLCSEVVPPVLVGNVKESINVLMSLAMIEKMKQMIENNMGSAYFLMKICSMIVLSNYMDPVNSGPSGIPSVVNAFQRALYTFVYKLFTIYIFIFAYKPRDICRDTPRTGQPSGCPSKVKGCEAWLYFCPCFPGHTSCVL